MTMEGYSFGDGSDWKTDPMKADGLREDYTPRRLGCLARVGIAAGVGSVLLCPVLGYTTEQPNLPVGVWSVAVGPVVLQAFNQPGNAGQGVQAYIDYPDHTSGCGVGRYKEVIIQHSDEPVKEPPWHYGAVCRSIPVTK